MHADGAVTAVVAHDHDNGQLVLRRGGEFLAIHQEVAVAVHGDHGPLRVEAFHRDRRGHAVPHRRRCGRDVGGKATEAVEAMDPGCVVAGAVTQDGVAGKVLAQPHHDGAEIDSAGLVGGRACPIEEVRMCDRRLLAPRNGPRRLQHLRHFGKACRRRMDRKIRPVDAAKLLCTRMNVDEFRPRARNVEQRIALRRDFAEAAADQHHEIGIFHARDQLWIGTKAKVAGVAGMERIKERQAPVAGRDRQRKALGEPRDRGARARRPAAAAEDEQRALRLAEEPIELRHLRRTGPSLDPLERRRVGNHDPLGQHVLRQRDHHRAGPAAGRRIERA